MVAHGAVILSFRPKSQTNVLSEIDSLAPVSTIESQQLGKKGNTAMNQDTRALDIMVSIISYASTSDQGTGHAKRLPGITFLSSAERACLVKATALSSAAGSSARWGLHIRDIVNIYQLNANKVNTRDPIRILSSLA
jgi:hypothetical protein